MSPRKYTYGNLTLDEVSRYCDGKFISNFLVKVHKPMNFPKQLQTFFRGM